MCHRRLGSRTGVSAGSRPAGGGTASGCELGDAQCSAAYKKGVILVRHDHEGHSILGKPQTIQGQRVPTSFAAVYLVCCPVCVFVLTTDVSKTAATAVYDPDIIAVKHGLVNPIQELITSPLQRSSQHSLFFCQVLKDIHGADATSKILTHWE